MGAMGAMGYVHTSADGKTHYLHGKAVMLPGGRPQMVFWFARRPAPGTSLDALPAGYRVTESARTGRPYVRKA